MSDQRIDLLKKALDALAAAAAAVGELDAHEIPGSFGDPLAIEPIIAGLAEVSGDLRDSLQTLEDQTVPPGVEDFEWSGVDEEEESWDEPWDDEDDDEPWKRGEADAYDDEDDGIDTRWPGDDD